MVNMIVMRNCKMCTGMEIAEMFHEHYDGLSRWQRKWLRFKTWMRGIQVNRAD